MPDSLRTVSVRLGAAFVLAALFLAAACSGGRGSSRTAAPSTPVRSPASRPPATEPARPAAIPAEARFVSTDTTFNGGAAQPASARPQLFTLACKDDVLAAVTSQIIELYARLPCDRAVPQQVADRFIGRHVTLRIVIGDAEKLYVDSDAGTIEFTIEGAWVKQ